MVHQTQLVVGEGAPGIIDWDRTRGFAAASVALIHCDAAEVVLENVHRVENRVWPVADARVQAAARGDQQRKAGTDLLVTDADIAFFVERGGASQGLITDREPLPNMFRLLEFIEHGHRIILHGDPALALGIDQKLVAAQAEFSCPLPGFQHRRRGKESPF